MLKHCHGTNFQCIISITLLRTEFFGGKLVFKFVSVKNPAVCFLPQASRFKRKGSRSVRIIGYVLFQRKENILHFPPQKYDKKSTFTELLKCYSAFPLSCVFDLSKACKLLFVFTDSESIKFTIQTIILCENLYVKGQPQ